MLSIGHFLLKWFFIFVFSPFTPSFSIICLLCCLLWSFVCCGMKRSLVVKKPNKDQFVFHQFCFQKADVMGWRGVQLNIEVQNPLPFFNCLLPKNLCNFVLYLIFGCHYLIPLGKETIFYSCLHFINNVTKRIIY